MFERFQNRTLILGEQLQSSIFKQRKRTKYKLQDEKLQQLVSVFHIISTDVYLKRVRALFNF